jgi:rhomboid protease GluP
MKFEREHPGDVWPEVFSTADRAVAAEMALVLEARGIAYASYKHFGRFSLSVPPHQLDVAREELQIYAREAAIPRGGSMSIPYAGSGWPGVWVYVGLLLLVALAVREALFGFDWVRAGSVDGLRISAGEWWRNVTALTIHRELDHLLGNLAFGSFYGYFVGRHLGSGLGWAAIVLAGAFGNAINVFLQGSDHRSIGASTAVFAALGILAAFTWRRGYHRNTPWRARIAPIIASLALLAYTGTGGENTDLGAHLFGFVAGIVGGLVLARFEIPTSSTTQAGIGLSVVAGIIVCWWLALAAS